MRKRIHCPGTFAGSTSDYGAIVDRYEPVLVSEKKEEHLEFVNNMPVILSKRREFESKNMFKEILLNINAYFPNSSPSKKSKMYAYIRKCAYVLLFNAYKKSLE